MLEDMVQIVTGAASGLGRATALELADQGATVIACDLGARSHGKGENEDAVEAVAAEIRGRGNRCTPSFGDITDEDYVMEMIDDAIDEHGRIDGAVNYAGFLRDGMLFNMTAEDWRVVLDVHLTGHFNLLKHLGGHWREAHKAGELDGERSVVAVSSASARGSVGQANYSAAKAGVLGLARTAARELDQYDVCVNAILPAAKTRMVDENIPKDIIEGLPTDEIGPEKVAPLPAVLLSDRTAGLTGWTFAIGSDSVFTVTDPAFEASQTQNGGWSAGDIATAIEELVEDRPRAKTESGSLLPEIT